uniref:Peptidase S1 domain-containing protein n=1 Tax=Podarcis muralis TaxID=64176 RepID=A0A670IJ71_PODMU
MLFFVPSPYTETQEICPTNNHSWLALLYDSDALLCSGMLITPDWVLTAAHCYIWLQTICSPSLVAGSKKWENKKFLPKVIYSIFTERDA